MVDIRKTCFTDRAEALSGKPREVAESPALEVFERCVDVVLEDMVLW